MRGAILEKDEIDVRGAALEEDEIDMVRELSGGEV